MVTVHEFLQSELIICQVNTILLDIYAFMYKTTKIVIWSLYDLLLRTIPLGNGSMHVIEIVRSL